MTAKHGHAKVGKEGLLNADPKALKHIQRMGVRAAMLGVVKRDSMHYTQNPARWDYIAKHNRAYKGQMPSYGDCSAFATGVIWDATLRYGPRDFVNGQQWKAGHTGTLVKHGRKVSLGSLRLLDLVFYGHEGWRPGHVAIYVGAGRVVSFGSEAGPLLLPVRYRSDVGIWAPRRYVH